MKEERNSAETDIARKNLPLSVASQEAVLSSEVCDEASIETTVVHSLGSIVRDEHKPYPIYKLKCTEDVKIVMLSSS